MCKRTRKTDFGKCKCNGKVPFLLYRMAPPHLFRWPVSHKYFLESDEKTKLTRERIWTSHTFNAPINYIIHQSQQKTFYTPLTLIDKDKHRFGFISISVWCLLSFYSYRFSKRLINMNIQNAIFVVELLKWQST